MYFFSWRFFSWATSILLVSNTFGAAAAENPRPLPVDDIIRRAVSRADQAQRNAGQNAYTYTKLTVTEELDPAGRVKDRKEKVYQVFFQSGATHLKLLTVNGRAPAHADIKQQSENDTSARQVLGQSKSAKAAENLLTPEVVARFNFTLVDETSINGRKAYHISFEPKRPAPPVHRIVDRLLDRISGTIWIDADEFEIAQAQIYLSSEVDLLGGVVGCLKKLDYTMTRTRVGDGLWFNTFSTGDFQGRKLLDWMRIKTKSQSSNFRPLG